MLQVVKGFLRTELCETAAIARDVYREDPGIALYIAGAFGLGGGCMAGFVFSLGMLAEWRLGC